MDQTGPMRDVAAEAENELLAGIRAVRAELMEKIQQAHDEAARKNGELLEAYQKLVFNRTSPKSFTVGPVPAFSGEAPNSMVDMSASAPSESEVEGETAGKRTAREIAIDVIRNAEKPIRWDRVIAAITAEGLREASAKKIRTKLTQDGTISFKGDLCALTPEGQRRFPGDAKVNPE